MMAARGAGGVRGERFGEELVDEDETVEVRLLI
jgi:hypothetical protein